MGKLLMRNPWMKQYYVLKKLKIAEEQLNDLVAKHKIIHRRYDNTYLRSDVIAISKEVIKK
jgi:hypothetical protein